ncbi:ATP-binding protein [Psychrosphaera haliotis]|uniref:AAA family ATPase n=1 Tax=Psychrosphaera haliotis TaxID=555083 RepID=UPI00236F77EA|nr:ATP-binding protein [Psychrosphaera haliotis]
MSKATLNKQVVTNKQVILLRGLPGAGKSTFIKSILKNSNQLSDNIVIHSTDHFFMTSEGYQFDPQKLPINHQKNQQAFSDSLKKGIPLVICDNTNIEYWQMKPYLEAAHYYGYSVEVISVGLFKNSDKRQQYVLRNSHNIEQEVVESMAKKSQRFNYLKHAVN